MGVTYETVADPKVRLVLRFLDAMDRKRFDEVEACLAPGFQIHYSALHLDRLQMMEMVRGVYASFSDLVHDVEETFAVGDHVILRGTIRGTHTGEFEGIPATGRPITLGQIVIVRVAQDTIAEIHEEVDSLVLMQQIGAFPVQAT